jgi:hypothetical protein
LSAAQDHAGQTACTFDKLLVGESHSSARGRNTLACTCQQCDHMFGLTRYVSGLSGLSRACPARLRRRWRRSRPPRPRANRAADAHQGLPHSLSIDLEMIANPDERPSAEVELSSFLNLLGSEPSLPPRHPGPIEVCHHCRAVDRESSGQLVDGCSRLIGRHQFGDLIRLKPVLDSLGTVLRRGSLHDGFRQAWDSRVGNQASSWVERVRKTPHHLHSMSQVRSHISPASERVVPRCVGKGQAALGTPAPRPRRSRRRGCR